MWKKIKKNKISLIIIGITTLMMAIIITSIEGPDKIWQALLKANPFWLVVAVSCFLTSWFLDIFGTHLLLKQFGNKNQTLKKSIEIGIIGKLFDCITPSSTGGQPVQIYRLNQEGMSIGRASSLLMMRLALFQFTSVTISSIVIFAGFRYFSGSIANFSFLAIIGLVANAAVGVGVFVVSVLPRVSRHLATTLLLFLGRLKIIKNHQEKLTRIDRVISEFSEGPKLLGQNKRLAAKLIALTIIQVLLFYSVPYFVFLGIGAPAKFIVPAVTAAACVYMVSSYVPLPGGSVGAEGSFFLFFSAIYKNDSVGLAVLIWRFITYYLPIIIGSFKLVGDNSRKVITGEIESPPPPEAA